MKKVLIVTLIWFIVAVFFYAAIWTNENNTLSERFLLTGSVAFAQILISFIYYSLTQIEN